jgi:undecaprenyl-diphosphatase
MKNQQMIFTQATIFGTIASFITGYIALILLLKIVNKGKLYLFAPYCWILGMAIIFYTF